MQLVRVSFVLVMFCLAIALAYGTLAQEGKKPCNPDSKPPWFNCPKGTPCSKVETYSDGEPTNTPGVVKCQLQIYICGWVGKSVFITPSKGESCPNVRDYFGISKDQPTFVNCKEYEKAKRTHQPCDPTKDLNCNCPECKPDKVKTCADYEGLSDVVRPLAEQAIHNDDYSYPTMEKIKEAADPWIDKLRTDFCDNSYALETLDRLSRELRYMVEPSGGLPPSGRLPSVLSRIGLLGHDFCVPER